ncbi:MAG: YncE family protein [Xanthomonadales bacterium]|nr:YncE family protein [Xanthomonadales bacterium]
MKHLSLPAILAVLLLTTGGFQPAMATGAMAQATGAAASTAATQAQVLRQAPAPGLYQLAYSPRQNLLYVVSAGGSGEAGEPSKLLWLDPDTLRVVGELALPQRGFGVALDDGGDRLYIGNSVDGSITVVDTQAKQISRVLQLAQKVEARGRDGKMRPRPAYMFRELVFDAPRQRLYLPGLSREDSTLFVVDTKALRLDKTVTGFGAAATGIALSPKGDTLYVSNLAGQLYLVDPDTLQIRKQVKVDGKQLLNLAFDAKHHQVLAIDQGSASPEANPGQSKEQAAADRAHGNRLVVIDAGDGKTVGHIATGQGPVALLLDEARNRLYVTNRGSGTVTIHDSSNRQLLRTVDLPTHPNSLALNPTTGAVYVTIKNGRGEAKGNESVARILP